MTPASLTWRPALRSARTPVRSAEVRVDRQAFDRAYRECQPDLSRYVRSIVRSRDLAEDVLQSVMVKALAALATEQRDFELRPWLFRIAHNEAIDAVRRSRPTDELDARVAAPDRSLSDQVEERRRLAELWADLEQLPERQRQALVLRELNGLGHAEIGAVLGTDARAVKQTIFEARQALLEYARGRDMLCAEVQRTLSDGDGRVRRGRRMRAHIRACAGCRTFDLALGSRPAELAALAPLLPLAGAGALAHGVLGGAAGGTTGTGTSASALGAGSGAMSTGTVTSALATKAAVVLVTGATAAAGGAEVAHVATSRAQPRAAVPVLPAVTGLPSTLTPVAGPAKPGHRAGASVVLLRRGGTAAGRVPAAGTGAAGPIGPPSAPGATSGGGSSASAPGHASASAPTDQTPAAATSTTTAPTPTTASSPSAAPSAGHTNTPTGTRNANANGRAKPSGAPASPGPPAQSAAETHPTPAGAGAPAVPSSASQGASKGQGPGTGSGTTPPAPADPGAAATPAATPAPAPAPADAAAHGGGKGRETGS